MIERVPVGTHIFREIAKGETWCWAPGGNGIIVAHPDRKPLWCRIEDGCYKQDWLEPAGITA